MSATPAEDPRTDFSLRHLEWILNSGNHFFRHDVDYDLGCARKMAMFESELGISSVYYLRSRAEEYRPGDPEFNDTVGTILAAGHSIGIHVDLGLPRDATVSIGHIESCAHEQLKELGLELGDSPPLSFHAPPQDALWRMVPGYRHAMLASWAGRYIADSRGVFRSSPIRIITGVWQVNLHPEWWFLPALLADTMRSREAVKP